MPIFIAALLGGLVSAAGTLVGRVLISLGIGYVTFTGVDASIAFAKAAVVAGVGALPANAIAVAGALKIGVCISILTSALVARMTLAGLTSGAVTKMVTKAT
jgi:hypothetical protein